MVSKQKNQCKLIHEKPLYLIVTIKIIPASKLLRLDQENSKHHARTLLLEFLLEKHHQRSFRKYQT
jgi:hypothetical protein